MSALRSKSFTNKYLNTYRPCSSFPASAILNLLCGKPLYTRSQTPVPRSPFLVPRSPFPLLVTSLTQGTSSALATYRQQPSREVEKNKLHLPQGKGVYFFEEPITNHYRQTKRWLCTQWICSQSCIDVNLLNNNRKILLLESSSRAHATFSSYENLRNIYFKL